MKPIEFPGHNVVFAKDQPEYQPLPAMVLPEDGTVITCWELSPQELEVIKKTGVVYLKQLTFRRPLQPVLLMAELGDDITFMQ